MARLAKYVFVGGRWFGPGDDVPSDVARKITSPSAWGQEAPAPAAEPEPAREPAKKPRKTPTRKPQEGTVQDEPAPSPAPTGTATGNDEE